MAAKSSREKKTHEKLTTAEMYFGIDKQARNVTGPQIARPWQFIGHEILEPGYHSPEPEQWSELAEWVFFSGYFAKRDKWTLALTEMLGPKLDSTSDIALII